MIAARTSSAVCCHASGWQDSSSRTARCGTAGPSLVDLAGPALAVEEDAVAVGKLDQALADSDLPDIAPLELGHLQFQERGQRLDLALVDPDVARRPGAAIAALAALESQAGMVPRFSLLHGAYQLMISSSPGVVNSDATSGIRP